MKAASPLVSIVIPTYNRAKTLGRALASVKAQSFDDFEVLVMDDGSTDDSRDVVESFRDERFKYEWAPQSGGPGRPRNRGIRSSCGKYVAFLDSDDWWLPNKLEESVRVLESGADVVYHDLIRTGRHLGPWVRRTVQTRQLEEDAFRDLLFNGNTLNTSSVVASKSLMVEIGGFSEAKELAVACEDYEAWLRLSKITSRFRRIDAPLGYYWEGGGNVSSPERMLRSIAILEELYGDELTALRRMHEIYWIAYAKGRAHFLLGNFDLARKFLGQMPWRTTAASINLKRAWMFAYMFVKARTV